MSARALLKFREPLRALKAIGIVSFSGVGSRTNSFCCLSSSVSNQSLNIPEMSPPFILFDKGGYFSLSPVTTSKGSRFEDKPGNQRLLHTLAYAETASRSVKVTQNLENLKD